MGPANQIQIMPIQKLRHDILPKGEGDTAIVLPPSVGVFIGIAPKQIAQQSRIRHVGGPHDPLDLIQTGELGTQPPVSAKDLFVNDGRAGQAVEAVREGLPQLDAEATFAFVVEAVDAVDGGAFVIAAEDEEVFGVFDFVGEQEADGLEGLFAAVYVVAEEDVVGLK